LAGTFQAIYTAGVLLPKPISVCRYHHRLINLKKLEEVQFARQPEKLTFQAWQRLYRLPETPLLALRPMVPADVPAVTLLLTQCALARACWLPKHRVTFFRRYLERFGIFQVFDEEEVKHWILPRPGIMSCYVLEQQNKKVTDFVSFYHLNSSILGHAKHKTLNACYMYYRVATTGSHSPSLFFLLSRVHHHFMPLLSFDAIIL
jgi:glycylpeptide N-tetradecanoyltransferase